MKFNQLASYYEQDQTHLLRIGRLVRSVDNPEQTIIFLAAYQLDHGSVRIKNEQDRVELIQLNLDVGKMSN